MSIIAVLSACSDTYNSISPQVDTSSSTGQTNSQNLPSGPGPPVPLNRDAGAAPSYQPRATGLGPPAALNTTTASAITTATSSTTLVPRIATIVSAVASDQVVVPAIPTPYVPSNLHLIYAQAGVDPSQQMVIVDPAAQMLYLSANTSIQGAWPVSTGRNGLSNRAGTGGTPTGLHSIGAVKTGQYGETFVLRNATGRVAELTQASSGDALMTSRLLVLQGRTSANANTSFRGIYIHGTNLEGSMGRPLSRGCIRMLNSDVITLANMVQTGSWVCILD